MQNKNPIMWILDNISVQENSKKLYSINDGITLCLSKKFYTGKFVFQFFQNQNFVYPSQGFLVLW